MRNPEMSALSASCRCCGQSFSLMFCLFLRQCRKTVISFFFFLIFLVQNWGPVIYFAMTSTVFGEWSNHSLFPGCLLGLSTQWGDSEHSLISCIQRGHPYTSVLFFVFFFFHCRGSRDGWYSGHNSLSVPALLNFSLYVFFVKYLA